MSKDCSLDLVGLYRRTMASPIIHSRERLLILLISLDMFFFIRGFAVSNLLEHISLAIVVLTPEIRQKFWQTVQRYKFIAWLLALWCWVVFAGIYSPAEPSEVFEDIWSWRKILLLPLMVTLVNTKSRAIYFSILFIWVGIFFLCLSFVMHLFDVWFWSRNAPNILQNHTAQGVYFSLAALMCVVLAREQTSTTTATALKGLAIFFFLNTFFVTDGRTGYLIGGVCLISSAIILSGQSKLRLKEVLAGSLIILIVIGVSIIFDLPLKNGIQLGFSNLIYAFEADTHSSAGIRTIMWYYTVQMISDQWLFGTGSGGFEIGYSAIVAGVEGWHGTITNNPHQQYLQILAEYGLVGLLLFLGFLYHLSWHVLKKHTGTYKAALLAILLSYIVMATFNGVFTGPILARLFWFLVPLLMALDEAAQRNK